MKKKLSLIKIFSVGIIFLVINSCKEVGPAIDLTETVYETFIETPEAPQERIVIIEDFTGAGCVNCPLAHEAIAEIISLHPGRIAALAIYNYPSDPLYIDENFRSGTADNVGEYLGATVSWPASIIDRVDFEDDNSLVEEPDNLLPFAEQELTKPTSCNIYLDPVYDNVSGILSLTVTIKYTEEITVPNHISVALAENGIIAAQVTPTGEVPDYVHNHVMRDMLTFYSGDDLPEENAPGRVYVFNYTYNIPSDWNSDNIEVIAFVHNFETDNKEILQGAIAPLN